MPSPRADVTKSKSFNGSASTAVPEMIRRPMTVPDLAAERKKLTKVLMNVTVQGSVGAVQVLMSPDSTVGELISATIKQYVKERRRPVVHSSRVDEFDLHYSQFSLQSLDREEKLASLGSRNFFMCMRREVADSSETTAFCSKEAEKAAKLGGPHSPWFKFMSFLF